MYVSVEDLMKQQATRRKSRRYIVAAEAEVGYEFKMLQVVGTGYETYDASYETDED